MVVEQAVRARVPPSTFTALLRRSKFATYDPRIGQIYTTFDGHAHRGDWGLKRPLAIRRRDAHLAIHTVDTLYQQTEWSSVHSDAVWLQKFEKLGVTPKLGTYSLFDPSPPWVSDPDFAQSDFDRARLRRIDENLVPAPEAHRMSEKRFTRYLRRLRKIAPEFKGFIEGQEERKKEAMMTDVKGLFANTQEKKKVEEVNKHLYPRIRSKGNMEDHQRFISAKYMEEYKNPNSTFIRPLPHPTAGLTYVNANALQNVYTHEPVPGRRLLRAPNSPHNADYQHYNTVVGGWIGSEAIKRPPRLPHMIDQRRPVYESLPATTDFGTREGDPRMKAREGAAWFRAVGCKIVRSPSVVGRQPARLDDVENGAKFEFRYIEWGDEARREVENPYRPGTFEYCGYVKLAPVVQAKPQTPSMTNQPRPRARAKAAAPRTNSQAVGIIDNLKKQISAHNVHDFTDDSY